MRKKFIKVLLLIVDISVCGRDEPDVPVRKRGAGGARGAAPATHAVAAPAAHATARPQQGAVVC